MTRNKHLSLLYFWPKASASVASSTTYLLDVLWGQPIKLAQVASTSELHENQRNDLLFFEIVPSHCFGASEASKIKFWTKNFNSSSKNRYFDALIFQEIEFFEHLRTILKLHNPKKFQFSKKILRQKLLLFQ